MPAQRRTRARNGQAKPGNPLDRENGLYLRNTGKDWTVEDAAYLWQCRRVEGQSYKQIQKRLLRSALSMRLKYHNLNVAHKELVAQGAKSAPAAESAPLNTEDGEGADRPMDGIEALLEAASITEKGCKADAEAAPEDIIMQETAPKVKKGTKDKTASSSAWPSSLDNVKIRSLVE